MSERAEPAGDPVEAATAADDATEPVAEPAPEALLREIGTATVRMDLRFWSGARQLETRTAQDAVIQSVLEAFGEQDVKTGDDVVTVKLVDGGGATASMP